MPAGTGGLRALVRTDAAALAGTCLGRAAPTPPGRGLGLLLVPAGAIAARLAGAPVRQERRFGRQATCPDAHKHHAHASSLRLRRLAHAHAHAHGLGCPSRAPRHVQPAVVRSGMGMARRPTQAAGGAVGRGFSWFGPSRRPGPDLRDGRQPLSVGAAAGGGPGRAARSPGVSILLPASWLAMAARAQLAWARARARARGALLPWPSSAAALGAGFSFAPLTPAVLDGRCRWVGRGSRHDAPCRRANSPEQRGSPGAAGLVTTTPHSRGELVDEWLEPAHSAWI